MKIQFKKIYFDFETTSPVSHTTNLLQATFFFTNKDNKIVDELNEYIKINENFESFTEEEEETLKNIHKISNQMDLDKHNEKAITNEKLLEKFEEKTTKFFKGDNFKYCEIYGWNCSTFDNVILQIKFSEMIKKVDFKYRIIDLKDRYFLLKNQINYFDNEDLNYFVTKNNYSKQSKNSLEVVYRFLIKDENLSFHNSRTDVLVLLKLNDKFNEIFDKFEK